MRRTIHHLDGRRFGVCLLVLACGGLAESRAQDRPGSDSPAGDAADPQPDERIGCRGSVTDTSNPTALHLEGTVGRAPVRMTVIYGKEQAAGVYYYRAHRQALVLRGGITPARVLALTETATAAGGEDTRPTGRLELRLNGAHADGAWTSVDGARTVPVTLRQVAAESCDWRGPWRRYRPPGSSITFEHPAGWIAFSSGAERELACAGPASLDVPGAGIDVRHGKGRPHPTHFALIRGRWHADPPVACFENPPVPPEDPDRECVPATVVRRQGLQIMLGDRSIDLFCAAGGRYGRAERDQFLILRGREWMEIDAPTDLGERILQSISAAEAP